jgi:hypothetical protein
VSFLHNFPTSLAFHCFRASDTSLLLLPHLIVPTAANTEVIMASASGGDTADLTEQRPRKRAKYTQVAWSVILLVSSQSMHPLMISVTNASGGSSNAAVEQYVHVARVIMSHVFTISLLSQRHPLRQSTALRKTGRKWFRCFLQSFPNVWKMGNSVSASHLESCSPFPAKAQQSEAPFTNAGFALGSRRSFRPSTGRLRHFNVTSKFCPPD